MARMAITYVVATLSALACLCHGLIPRVSLGEYGCTGFGLSCTMQLSEGLDKTISITLDEPIICENQKLECSVIVNISNSHPDIVIVEPCYVRWEKLQWHQTRTVNVRAVTNYQHDNTAKQIHLETNVVSQANYYNCTKVDTDPNIPEALRCDPLDIYIEATNTQTASCSSSGDPHYNTFDSNYWHYYDSSQPTTLYRSTVRDLTIMTKTTGYPGRNCAIAGRENRDRVVVDKCGGGLQFQTNYHSQDESVHPQVTISGNTYTVYFNSGSWMRTQVNGWGMNVYTGSVDKDTSCGLCGNFDGSAGNDVPGYVITNYNSLWGCMKVPSVADHQFPNLIQRDNVFNWVYNEANFIGQQSQGVPNAQETCPYELQPVIFIEIEGVDVEVIAEQLEILADEIQELNNNIAFNGQPNETQQVVIYPLDLAEIECQRTVDASTIITVCDTYAEFNESEYVEDCTEDYSHSGGPNSALGQQFLANTIQTMEQDCLLMAVEKGDQNNETVTAVLCQNACNGHGQCGGLAVCTCDDGWEGEWCNIDTASPPKILQVSALAYDCSGLIPDGSPKHLLIYGTNLMQGKTASLKCKFGSNITDALSLGPTSILCPVPAIIHRGATPLMVPLQLSNNGVLFSTVTQSPIFMFYDGTCQVCTANKTCSVNPSTCTVGNTCFHQNAVKPATDSAPVNFCLQCLPSVSNTEFSYVYGSSQCKPRFEQTQYSYTIVGNASAAEPLFFVNGLNNPNMIDAPGYSVTYTYQSGANVNVTTFSVNPTTGGVSLINDIDITDSTFQGMEHAASNPLLFNGFFLVRATDNQGYSTTATIIIDFVPASHAPVFPEGGYQGYITENSPSGTPVLNETQTGTLYVEAEDPDLFTSGLSYDFFLIPTGFEGVFVLNSSTGELKVGPNAGKLNYEVTDGLLLQVRVEDNNNIFHVTDVFIHITNVNEPPTAISVVPSTVPEGSGERTVGVLSAVDPEGGVMTYTTSTSGFHINKSGNTSTLVMTKTVDFETVSDRTQMVEITVKDNAGNEFTTTLSITVTNVNEPPHDVTVLNIAGSLFQMTSGTTASIFENATVGTTLAEVTATDPEGDEVTCLLANTFFTIVDKSLLQLRIPLDFEQMASPHQISLEIACKDTNELFSNTSNVVVTVMDVDEPPSLISFTPANSTVVEGSNRTNSTLIGVIVIADNDADSTADIPINAPDGYNVSNIVCNPLPEGGVVCFGDLFLLPNTNINFEDAGGNHGQTQIFTNLGLPGSDTSIPITFQVADAPDLPTGITMNANSIQEGAPEGSIIAEMVVNDEDTSDPSFDIIFENNPSDAFAVRPSTSDLRRTVGNTLNWELIVNNASFFDYEVIGSTPVSFSVKVIDNNVPAPDNFIIYTSSIQITDKPLVLVSNSSQMSRMVRYSGLSFNLLNQDSPAMNGLVTYTIASVTPVSLSSQIAITTVGDSGILAVTNEIEIADGQFELTIEYSFSGTLPSSSYNSGVRVFSIGLAQPEVGPTIEFISATNSGLGTSFAANVYVANQNAAISQQVSKIRINNPSGSGDAAIASFNSPTAWTNGIPATCTNVNLLINQPFGADTNRYFTDCEYISANYGSLDTSELKSATKNFQFTQQASVENDEIIPIEFNGVVGNTPRLETIYIRVVDKNSDTGLAAFAVLEVSFSDACGIDVNGVQQHASPCNADQICITVINGFQCADTTTTVTTTTETTTTETEAAPIIIITLGNKKGDAVKSSGTSVALIVGILLMLLIILIVMLAAYFRHQKTHGILFDSDIEKARAATYMNETYASTYDVQQTAIATSKLYEEVGFHPGVSNPMYDWYQPTMTRKESTDYLMGQGEGAFVVRDSDANPGWFMLGVKTHNLVVHDKIRLTENQQYELLPSMGAAAEKKQQGFINLPELVEHYCTSQPDMHYTLATSNPIYDNHQLIQERTGEIVQVSINGEEPSLPSKERHYEESPFPNQDAADMGGDALNNPMYGVQDEEDTMVESGYLDVTGLNE